MTCTCTHGTKNHIMVHTPGGGLGAWSKAASIKSVSNSAPATNVTQVGYANVAIVSHKTRRDCQRKPCGPSGGVANTSCIAPPHDSAPACVSKCDDNARRHIHTPKSPTCTCTHGTKNHTLVHAPGAGLGAWRKAASIKSVSNSAPATNATQVGYTNVAMPPTTLDVTVSANLAALQAG